MNLLQLPPAVAALVVTFLLNARNSVAQYPPSITYNNTLQSPIDNNVTVSYKQPDEGTCMTAFPTQKQYTGYINLPPYTLSPIQQNYSINTFFWFIEARQVPESAPLTIWLNGGPGSSSMVGLFNEVGPCEVVQMSDGTYGTQSRLWGWDRSSNILFIDQPSQVGFSYDTATNASYNLFTNEIFEPPTEPNGLPPYMYLNGTFGTGNTNEKTPWATTANTTDIAARATWHFLQSWLAAFPQYNPATRPNITSYQVPEAAVGIHLFTESYGGKYGPVFATFFEEQNQMRLNGTLPMNSTLAVQLESVGILNGLVDDAIQDYWYPFFAYNNTYDIQAYSQVEQLNTLQAYDGAGGCLDRINQCRAAMNSTDPDGDGDVEATNQLCETAQYFCANITAPYVRNGFNVYDIREKLPTPDPPAAYQEYLNNETVLASIGARVNYTESNPYVQEGFISTGDTIRGGQIDDLAYLLSLGIRVALIYGDADFICNWYGGQAVSLAVAAALPTYPNLSLEAPATAAPVPYSSGFPAAGYAEIVVNQSYVGGAVRQYGNLSFSRIYDAGHLVPYYQPETAFTVFTRIIQGTEISTGDVIDLSTFGSTGPQNATFTNTAPEAPEGTCWVRAWNMSCSPEDTEAMQAGKGLVANGIYYQDDASVSLPSSSVTAGVPGQPMTTSYVSSASSDGSDPTSTMGLTGVYTATATPSPSSSKGAAPAALPAPLEWQLGPGLLVVASVALGVVALL